MRIELAEPVPEPVFQSPRLKAQHKALFFHPAYPNASNLLLILYAWDTPNGGIHAGTAWLACAIVACNAWDGYLTKHNDSDRLEYNDDDVLPPGSYDFHVPNPSGTDPEPYQYPLCPSFQHWSFPHEALPPQWPTDLSGPENDQDTVSTPSASTISAAVLSRDSRCIISRCRDSLERAHLCPRDETDWFGGNSMHRYSISGTLSGGKITDDIANAVAMREDIHTAFDRGKFVITRKAGNWVAHFVDVTNELGNLYHNRPLTLKSSVSSMFLLARFAWTIFPMVRTFVEAGYRRHLRTVEVMSDGFGLGPVDRIFNPTEISNKIFGGSRGRSQSPKKRKTSDANLPDIVEDNIALKRRRTAFSLDTPVHFQQSSAPSFQDSLAPGNIASRDIEAQAARFDGHENISDCSHGLSDPVEVHYKTQRKSLVSDTDSSLFMQSQNSCPSLSNDSPGLEQAQTPPPVNGNMFTCNNFGRIEREVKINEMRRAALLRERMRLPPDGSLLCCDYTIAEFRNAHGIPGPDEWGGSQICEQCLGLEVV
ncbi:hypothetical protein F5884DRAFT_813300 [Xylogone sp. PMI_703]|nr:hypothetical protein F5884DRAFT_813300 [Xylogone sp. PMI_703]